jgi:magnesium-transporting ATPase (P-type)
MDYLFKMINLMLSAMSNIWFWLFILSLFALGRYIFETEKLDYAGRNDIELSAFDKKRRRRLLFWGRLLFSIGIPFIILFVIFCLIF